MLERLLTVLPHKPNLTQQDRSDILELLRRATYPSQGQKSIDLVQRVLDCARFVNWEESELYILREMRAHLYKAAGKSDAETSKVTH